MEHYLLYNGQLLKPETPLIGADNRGLRYGDGLFETLLMSDGRIRFADWHFERLFTGLSLLGFQIPPDFTTDQLSAQILGLCRENKHQHARVRLTVFRGNGGLYDPEDDYPHLVIQTWPLQDGDFHLNTSGLQTGIYQAGRKAADAFSALKTNNYLLYAMAALHAKRQRWDEALVLNCSGRVCDSTIANVFIVKNETIYTCPLTEGSVAGILRRYLMEALPGHGFSFCETPVSIPDILGADEVFFSNSIRGIRWAQACESASYGSRMVSAIYDKLLKKCDK